MKIFGAIILRAQWFFPFFWSNALNESSNETPLSILWACTKAICNSYQFFPLHVSVVSPLKLSDSNQWDIFFNNKSFITYRYNYRIYPEIILKLNKVALFVFACRDVIAQYLILILMSLLHYLRLNYAIILYSKFIIHVITI